MEKNKKKTLLSAPTLKDSIFVGLCSVGLFAYSLYHHYNDRNVGEWKMSPYLFPTLISVFGFLLAVSLFFDARRELRVLNAQEETDEKPAAKKNWVGVGVLIGASILYYIMLQVFPVLRLPLVGRVPRFIPMTILFLLGLFIYLGERKWWKLILLSVLTTGAIYALFGIALHVRLP